MLAPGRRPWKRSVFICFHNLRDFWKLLSFIEGSYFMWGKQMKVVRGWLSRFGLTYGNNNTYHNKCHIWNKWFFKIFCSLLRENAPGKDALESVSLWAQSAIRRKHGSFLVTKNSCEVSSEFQSLICHALYSDTTAIVTTTAVRRPKSTPELITGLIN